MPLSSHSPLIFIKTFGGIEYRARYHVTLGARLTGSVLKGGKRTLLLHTLTLSNLVFLTTSFNYCVYNQCCWSDWACEVSLLQQFAQANTQESKFKKWKSKLLSPGVPSVLVDSVLSSLGYNLKRGAAVHLNNSVLIT